MKLRRMLLFMAVFPISLQVAAQDLIFKKNGEIVKAKILEANDESLSYKLYNTVDSLTHVINTHAIDSIIYQNGIRTSFKKANIDSNQPLKDKNAYNPHHLVGLDLAGCLLYKNLTFSYEYLPGNAKLGFKAAFAKKVGSIKNQSSGFGFNRIPDWTARLGINYYLFPRGTFRLGTGCYYIAGKYYFDDFHNYGSTKTNPPGESKGNVNGMIINVFGFYNLSENLAINFGLDTPLFLNPSTSVFNVAIRCEMLFNF